MSNPADIGEALDAAVDAFNNVGYGRPNPEAGIDTDDDWKTQLTKGCRLLAVVEEASDDGYYTALIELCFGIIERSLEAYAPAEGGDELRDFQEDSHDRCYDRAAHFGLISRDMAADLKDLYGNNRTDSYYGGRRPTDRQAQSMHRLARAIHNHVVGHIREGGVCNCDNT